MGTQDMATIRMVGLWQDQKSKIFFLRRRVPARYRAVAGRGETVKITTGATDKTAAEKAIPDVLRRWAGLVETWERRLNMVTLTPARAREIAAQWAAWIDGGAKLEMGGEDSDVFEPLAFPEDSTAETIARMWDVIERHAVEALQLARIIIEETTRPLLLQAMSGPVAAAYQQVDLMALGVSGSHPAVSPLKSARASLPHVPDAPAKVATQNPHRSLKGLYEAWKVVAVVKPRTMAETEYAFKSLSAFLGNDDAAQVTRDVLAKWRDNIKGAGATNNTWNNRLSMVRQFLVL